MKKGKASIPTFSKKYNEYIKYGVTEKEMKRRYFKRRLRCQTKQEN